MPRNRICWSLSTSTQFRGQPRPHRPHRHPSRPASRRAWGRNDEALTINSVPKNSREANLLPGVLFAFGTLKGAMKRNKAQSDGFLLFCLGALTFVALGFLMLISRKDQGLDFRIAYSSARCLLEHRDPYNQSDLLLVYAKNG